MRHRSSIGSKQQSRDVAPHVVSNLVTLFESLETMPTDQGEINEWWCDEPRARAQPSAPARKKRKMANVDDGGATGIFDDPDESSSDDEGGKGINARERRKVPALLSLATHRRAFADAFLALLSLPMSAEEAKRLLLILHQRVMPHMPEPRRLMDWLVDETDRGGTGAILALNGVFTLIQKHGLEYPDFYAKLYALLDRNVLHVRYRSRFLRLLDVFMSSTHLPAALVASFLKRLSRHCLFAPPAAIVAVLPLIYNLLKRHPSCMVLIHRRLDEDEEDSYSAERDDPFKADESSPYLTNAIDSSLWELSALSSHASATVSTLAKVFSQVMGKPRYDLEDFLDHSYATLFRTETTDRVIRKAPAIAGMPKRQPIKDSFFPSAKKPHEGEEDLEEPVDVVSEFFTF